MPNGVTVDNNNLYKGRKTCTLVKNVATIWLLYHDFPGMKNLNFKFHDCPRSVRTLE